LKRGKGLLVCFERLVHLKKTKKPKKKNPEGVCKCVPSSNEFVRKIESGGSIERKTNV